MEHKTPDTRYQSKRLRVTAAQAGARLDIWLSRHLPELSRSRIQSLIKSGHVSVDGRCVSAHYKVSEGREVRIEIPPTAPTQIAAENIPLDVLFEDSDIIVVNKPAGLVVHPAAGHTSGTLVNALLYHCDDLGGVGGELRPGIVHRLDKNTSGVMVAVKNDHAFASLVRQFKSGNVRKEYLAIVYGIPDPTAGRIETLIARSRHDRKKMCALPASVAGVNSCTLANSRSAGQAGKIGRLAVTHYKVEEIFDGICLMRLKIETGRTHQIRVHMTHVGHPVVGDTQYGRRRNAEWRMANAEWAREKVGRQMLHAELLAFRHPREGKKMEFRAPMPEDMKTLLDELRMTVSASCSRGRTGKIP